MYVCVCVCVCVCLALCFCLPYCSFLRGEIKVFNLESTLWRKIYHLSVRGRESNYSLPSQISLAKHHTGLNDALHHHVLRGECERGGDVDEVLVVELVVLRKKFMSAVTSEEPAPLAMSAR